MSFSDFWSGANNPSLPKSEYLYGTKHLIILAITISLCIILSLIFYKKSNKAKKILFYVLGGIFIFFEISSRIRNLCFLEEWTFKEIFKILMPMHICSVMVVIFIFSIFTKSRALKEFAVIGGLLATLAYLLYPAVGLNKMYWSFASIYSTFSHMLGFITVILMLTLKQVNFEYKRIWTTFLCFGIMFSWGLLLDFVIFPGSDYMYIVNDPLELNLNFPYQILYGFILTIYINLFYLINLIINKIKKHKKNVI